MTRAEVGAATRSERNMYKQLLNLADGEKRRYRDEKWRLNNRETIRRQGRECAKRNVERNRVRKMKWRHANPEKFRAQWLCYQTAKPHVAAAATARRRARKINAAGEDIAAVKQIYKRAKELRSYGLSVHVDHIIPLAKGGRHTADNLQIISASDNQRKSCFDTHTPIFVFE